MKHYPTTDVDPQVLVALANARMPFGRFKGRLLSDLPENYLLWFQHEGWPNGILGQQMAAILDMKVNGLVGLLQPLRAEPWRSS